MRTKTGPTTRPRTALCVVGLLCVGAALAGCDRPAVEEAVLPAGEAAPFAVAATSVKESALAAGDDLVVRFNRPLDRASFGPRSVTVRMPRRRRVSGALVRTAPNEVRIPADALRTLGPEEIAELRIEGGASPCAVRSEDGVPLAERQRIAFRIEGARRADVVGPSLVAARPADAATDVAPGALVELRFSEPLFERSTAAAVTLREDGTPVATRIRLAPDRRRILVRPQRPLRAGAIVEAEVHGSLADAAGNLLDRASPTRITFHVRRSTALELDEDFSSDEYADRSSTDCAWGEAEEPGVLAPRRGPRPLACLDDEPTTELAGDEIRFQVMIRGDETAGGLGSALRVRLARLAGAGLRAARVEGGPLPEAVLDPWFLGNRERARLELLADDTGPFDPEPDGDGGAWVEVPFVRPLAMQRGVPLLLDVTLTLEPGARVAAAADTTERALVRGATRERLLPSATLLVTGAEPTARSLWYDAGFESVRWRGAVMEFDRSGTQSGAVAEFQSAPADARGVADETRASYWAADPALVPPARFIRFRLRFGGLSPDARLPRVDRVAILFDQP